MYLFAFIVYSCSLLKRQGREDAFVTGRSIKSDTTHVRPPCSSTNRRFFTRSHCEEFSRLFACIGIGSERTLLPLLQDAIQFRSLLCSPHNRLLVRIESLQPQSLWYYMHEVLHVNICDARRRQNHPPRVRHRQVQASTLCDRNWRKLPFKIAERFQRRERKSAAGNELFELIIHVVRDI